MKFTLKTWSTQRVQTFIASDGAVQLLDMTVTSQKNSGWIFMKFGEWVQLGRSKKQFDFGVVHLNCWFCTPFRFWLLWWVEPPEIVEDIKQYWYLFSCLLSCHNTKIVVQLLSYLEVSQCLVLLLFQIFQTTVLKWLSRSNWFFEWDYPWLGLYYTRKGFGSVTL